MAFCTGRGNCLSGEMAGADAEMIKDSTLNDF
jgi:hypothetical protein